MHVIFLVHGMGSHEKEKWSAKAQGLIREYYDPQKYGFLERYPFKDNFAFCEIGYNELFDEYLAEARKQADPLGSWSKLAKPIDGEELGILRRIVGHAGSAPSDDFEHYLRHPEVHTTSGRGRSRVSVHRAATW